MHKGRLEAFSDGVLAIIITIMVLEIKVPHQPDFAALRPLVPVFVSYVLSFVYVGIYWNNHHLLLASLSRVNGRIMWANLNLLFWLSLIPFVTGWMGENHFAAPTLVLYGVVLLLAGVAYWVLQAQIIRAQGPGSLLAAAVGRDLKGRMSPVLYASGIGASFWHPWAAFSIYAAVALMWLVPDPRIERRLHQPKEEVTGQ